jgi:hypothetical protein
MKRNAKKTVLSVLVLILLTSCTGISENEFEALHKEKKQLELDIIVRKRDYQLALNQTQILTQEIKSAKAKINDAVLIDNYSELTKATNNLNENIDILGSYWTKDKELYILYGSGVLIIGRPDLLESRALYFYQAYYQYDKDRNEISITFGNTTTVYELSNSEDKTTISLNSEKGEDMVWSRIVKPNMCVDEGDCEN